MNAHDTTDTHHTSYVTIWATLMAILFVSLATALFHLSESTLVTILFGAAAVKAFLVLRHFMHLRGVTPWLYTIVCVPLLLAIFMIVAFVPDIGLYVWRGPLAAPAVTAGAEHGAE